MIQLVTTLFGIYAGGQLIVAATAKLSGFETFSRWLNSRGFAGAFVAAEVVIGGWGAVGAPFTPWSMWALAAFYAVGAVHRAQVVLSPTKQTCLCAHPGKATSWFDVTSNVVIAAIAAALVTALTEIPQFCSLKFPTPGRFRS